MVKLRELSKKQREEFYQSKFNYYREFDKYIVIVATLAYLSFFFTDCGLFGRFAYETVLSRFIVVVPMIVFLILHKRTDNYRIMVPATYLMIHIIIWCTDWATYLLDDRQYAVAGMIIMNLIFVCAGFTAPFLWSTLFHLFLVVDILVANMFIHYDDLSMMLMFNVPCVVAVCCMHNIMQKVYLDHYLTKESMQNMLVHDQLTGILNRNKLKELTDVTTGKFIFSKDIDVSMFIIDIDHFKDVNDTYGHDVGDEVLKYLATKVKGMLRASDYVIRWGGEEFLVIVPGCGLEEATALAERIRESIENDGYEKCAITVSIGVTTYTGGGYKADVKKADIALYEAKNTGRNKVCVYQEENDTEE